jgi:hypothetical protein
MVEFARCGPEASKEEFTKPVAKPDPLGLYFDPVEKKAG